MSFNEITQKYLEICDSEQSLRELRKNAWQFLDHVDKQLSSQYHNAEKPSLCPRCRSSNTRKNGKKQNRSCCLDCRRSYSNNLDKPHIFHNKRYPKKFLDLICLIYKTDKKTSEILNELNLSGFTYFKWKKEILTVLPFLSSYFANRR